MSFYCKIKEICKKHNKNALFIDMDGTIVEYEVYPEGFVTNETKDVFLQASPLEIVINNLQKVNEIENLDLYILSLSRSNIIVKEKINWLKRFVPFIKEENYIILNKEKGDYNSENREWVKSLKMKEKLAEYSHVMLLDDEHKILKRTQKELKENVDVFHISSAII